MTIAGPPLDAPLDLNAILKRGVDAKPDADALVSRRRRWTWRMLDTVSTRLAGNYLGLGLAPGDRIASLMPNRTELMLHYFACMKCGLVAVPMHLTARDRKLERATGLEPATTSLEGWCATNCATPAQSETRRGSPSRMQGVGFEPT